MVKHFDHGYAHLIAVDQNAASGAALPDVAGPRGVLVHPDRYGYATENVRMKTGKDSSRDGIMAGLDWLQARLKADPSGDATAVIYFTGHGHVEGGNYTSSPTTSTSIGSRRAPFAPRTGRRHRRAAAQAPARRAQVLARRHPSASAVHGVAIPSALLLTRKHHDANEKNISRVLR